MLVLLVVGVTDSLWSKSTPDAYLKKRRVLVWEGDPLGMWAMPSSLQIEIPPRCRSRKREDKHLR